jgi:hypothetical protein
MLRRSPFMGGNDLNDVFDPIDSVPPVPMSAIEDIGVTPEVASFIRNGAANSSFETDPPDTTAVLDDIENKLPDWSFVLSSGTAITAKCASGNVTWTMAAGAAGDFSYLEQVVPVDPSSASVVSHMVMASFGAGSAGNGEAYLAGQYLTAAGANTGSPAVDFSVIGITSQIRLYIMPDSGSSPTDAAFLRIHAGFRRGASATSATETRALQAITVRTSEVVIPSVLILPVIVYQAIGSGKDDWSPTGWRDCTTLAVDFSGAGQTVTGFAAPVSGRQGTVRWIYNIHDTNSLTLADESGSSLANNRIHGNNRADVVIRPNGSVMLMWFGAENGTAIRWRVMSER